MKDGHIHTPFCPHGTKDQFEEYIERAILLGFTEITFTEHAPLPKGFVDTTPLQDSGMKIEELEDYFAQISKMKECYKGKIKINCGLEVDYIEGFEERTTEFLNEYGPNLDDAILSVHFLKKDSIYDCVDYSPDHFAKMIERYGSIDFVYENYYRTVQKSIHSNLGPFKPRRIGHITLVKKFQKRFQTQRDYQNEIRQILQSVKEKNYELDYNGAGMAKPLCGEPYPSKWIAEEARQLEIPLIYGSDAHQAKELSQGFSHLIKFT